MVAYFDYSVYSLAVYVWINKKRCEIQADIIPTEEGRQLQPVSESVKNH